MPDGKPSVRQIAEASNAGALNGRHGKNRYEIIKFHDVEILMPASKLYPAIEITAEFTHSPEVEELAKEMGITLRRFR